MDAGRFSETVLSESGNVKPFMGYIECYDTVLVIIKLT